MPDAFHVFLLGVNALVLSCTVALFARTRYHSSRVAAYYALARAARTDALKAAQDARRYADAEPTILPFAKLPAPKLVDLDQGDGMHSGDRQA